MSSSEEMKHLPIPLQDISLATNGFDQENFIAKGGFGNVYYGKSEKYGIIAVKRLDPQHRQGDHEFRREIDFLSVYKHENIVTLLGFCDEEGEKILVYKYESKGSLDKLLKSNDLTWIRRLQICLDAARGLKYLHDDVGPTHRILHRDIKSANILLDENFKAKVSDFGLSREAPANVQTTFVISNVCGTGGYVDPDYYYGGQLTQKSDVFSFGVVLFEVLCGRLAYVKINGQFFNIVVQKHYKEQTLDEIIHQDIREQINPASLLTFSAVAYQCLKNAVERPTMEKVVEQLQKALDNQQTPSGPWPDVYNASHDEYNSDFDALQRQSGGTASSSRSWKYDVYLSFRGQDTRKDFVDHLFVAFVGKSVRTFKDDELSPGEPIGPSLRKAIEGSKIAIVVFSKNYANSSWCLEELVHVMNCRKEMGQIVIPVFYDVGPDDVREQLTYRDAFVQHEFNNKNKVESWRQALKDASRLSGINVRDRCESESIDEIIAYTLAHRIFRSPSPEASPQTSLLFGIENRVRDFKLRLQPLSDAVQMVAICGIWGSGKSTLASSVYDEIRLDFEGYCFVKDVSAESRMHGLKMLQQKILSALLRSKLMLSSIEEGTRMMKSRLRHNSVLIVLDDVNHIDHLEMLAGSHDWFGDGSLIIITTRNKDLADAHYVDITHDVEMLDVNEAVNLFSRHAFGTSTPVQGFEEVSRNLVSKLGGHPSALISLGSFLHGKDMSEWIGTLVRLEGITVDEILKKFNNTRDDGVTRNIHSWLAS